MAQNRISPAIQDFRYGFDSAELSHLIYSLSTPNIALKNLYATPLHNAQYNTSPLRGVQTIAHLRMLWEKVLHGKHSASPQAVKCRKLNSFPALHKPQMPKR